jgi:hypothetical protein
MSLPALGCIALSVLAGDSRLHPLTIDDAAWSIRPAAPGIQLAGSGVLLVSSPGLCFRSARDGQLIRNTDFFGVPCWTSGADLDGDKLGDLLIGDPRANRGAGWVRAVSGQTSRVLIEIHGSRPQESLGSAVLFLGDLDHDGCPDFALAGNGLSEAQSTEQEFEASIERLERTDGRLVATLKDGSHVDVGRFYAELRQRPISRASFVSVRSGKSGTELWRVELETRLGFSPQSLELAGDFDRDGRPDLLVRSLATTELVALSAQDGGRAWHSPGHDGLEAAIGDLDGDSIPDFAFRPERERNWGPLKPALACLSGADQHWLFALPYPEPLIDRSWAWESLPDRDTTIPFALGDLDGDGVPEIGVGLPWFHLESKLFKKAPIGPVPQPFVDIDLHSLTLEQALELKTDEFCDPPASGCALVYSGKSQRLILGVWGRPGSREGLGEQLLALPDFSGDGLADLLVVGQLAAYAFAGPGRAVK